MFRLAAQNFRSQILNKNYKYGDIRNNSTRSQMKITICGAAGKTAQSVALLLKTSPLVDELALYDVEQTNSIAQELSHIDTDCKVISYSGKIKDALTNAQIVAVLASAPATTNNFQANAAIISTLMTAIAEYSPKALIAIATTPINSLVPLAAEVLKKYGVYKPTHLFGIATINVMRANALVARMHGLTPENVHVPIIGGNSNNTVIPVLSQTNPPSAFKNEEVVSITNTIQNAAEETIQKTYCQESFLSGAASIAQFILSLIRAIKGEKGVIECSFVPYDDYPNLGYFMTPVELGIDGLQLNMGIPKLSEYEYCLLLESLNHLKADIKRGIKYVTPHKPKNSRCPSI